LFQQAAAQGRVNAYSKLGDLYASDDGDGIGQDYGAAIRWYDEAARNGDPRGLYKLGYAYEEGKGVKADPVRALMWYSLASEEGYEPAAARIERVAGQLDPEQRTQAEALAADWRRDNAAP
jgi:TPR repeat protein